MAKIRKPLIPAKMFKHFAMATVALTAAVAMLADGSHREAAAESEQARIEASPPAAGKPALVRRDSGGSSRESQTSDYGAEPVGSFGEPMMRPAQAGGSIALSRARTEGKRPPVAGYSQGYLDSLSDEEYEALVEGLREAGMLDPEQRAAQLTALEMSSASRSGKATRD